MCKDRILALGLARSAFSRSFLTLPRFYKNLFDRRLSIFEILRTDFDQSYTIAKLAPSK